MVDFLKDWGACLLGGSVGFVCAARGYSLKKTSIVAIAPFVAWLAFRYWVLS